MSKHTPGPWKAAELFDYADFDGMSRVIIGDDRRIAVVQHKGDEEDEANTVLIEAAPDMLKALEDIIADAEYLALVGDNHARRMKAKAAIAKAKGETE